MVSSSYFTWKFTVAVFVFLFMHCGFYWPGGFDNAKLKMLGVKLWNPDVHRDGDLEAIVKMGNVR